MSDLKREQLALVLGDQPVGARNLFHAPHPEQRSTLCGQAVGAHHLITVKEATSLGGVPCPLCVSVVEASDG